MAASLTQQCSSIFNRLAPSLLPPIFGTRGAYPLVTTCTLRKLVLIMKEIWIVAGKLLSLAGFIASTAFYGLVFWHWRNEAKQKEGRSPGQENPYATR